MIFALQISVRIFNWFLIFAVLGHLAPWISTARLLTVISISWLVIIAYLWTRGHLHDQMEVSVSTVVPLYLSLICGLFVICVPPKWSLMLITILSVVFALADGAMKMAIEAMRNAKTV